MLMWIGLNESEINIIDIINGAISVKVELFEFAIF